MERIVRVNSGNILVDLLHNFLNMEGIWSGVAHWDDGAKLQVVDGMPAGAPMPDAVGTPYQFAPEVDPSEVYKFAQR